MKTLTQSELIEYARRKEIKGTGSEFSPFIFERFDFLDEYGESLKIVKSKLHIMFVGIVFPQQKGRVVIKRCKNMSFKNCKFFNFELKKCSAINFYKCEFDTLHLRSCLGLELDECTSRHLHIYRCFENSFRGCIFKFAVNVHSKGNVFEKGSVIPDDYNDFLNGTTLKVDLIILATLLILLFSTYTVGNFSLVNGFLAGWGASIFGFFILLVGLLYVTYIFVRDRLVKRQYLPNIIIS